MGGFVSADSEGKKVKLTFTKDKSILKLSWPTKLNQGSYPFQNPSSIYGSDVSIKVQKKGRSTVVQLDCDGSPVGKPRPYNKTRPIGFNISGKLGEKTMTLPLILEKIFTSGSKGIYAKKYPGWAMKGSFGRTVIYLIDANLDGQFDTSGKDYIAIGSVNAIRFRKQTSIDGKFYNMSVTSDGSELTLLEVKPKNLCKVTTNKKLDRWGVLALSNSEGTYNIAAKNCDLIPAGEYKINYGLWGKGINKLYLVTNKNFNPQLDIRENNTNIINLGAPFSLGFTATISGNNVTVNTNISIVGNYGENYYFRSSSRGRMAPPSIAVFADKKAVHSGKMGFG